MDIKRNLQDDQIFRDCLSEALDGAKTSVEFDPPQKIESSKLLLANPDDLKAFFEEALALNTTKGMDIKHEFSSKFEEDQFMQNFKERHEKISYDWGKAKNVLKKSMSQYEKQLKKVDLKSNSSLSSHFMLPIVNNFKQQIEDIEKHESEANMANEYLQSKIEDMAKKFL